MTDVFELTITRLGSQGDGIAETSEGAVFLPYVLAGEQVRAQMQDGRARLVDVVVPSADRIAPICQHFTVCGGCTTQHMAALAEQAWKTALVATAFSQQRIDTVIHPIIASKPGTRRRAVFAARRTKAGAILGFHEPRTHDIVDLAQCPILSPDIESRIPALRALAAALVSRSGEARMTVTVVDNGVDVVVEDAKPDLNFDERATIAGLARAARIIRLTVKGETVYESGEPLLRFGLARIVPAPGVFLQAVPEVEAAMTALILAAVGPKAKRVADLFCGAGTFTFPMAARCEVLAVDGDKLAIAALEAAFKRGQGMRPVTAKARDLFREPMSAKELERCDAVVFDPPRAGADAQARMIAKSKVPTVIAVSCAPSTLARDVRTLMEGGYVVESVTPIDQFLFSPHVEAVAVLRRPKR
jgi:23S rRNA (uracil1939-C5)-methyltransferase